MMSAGDGGSRASPAEDRRRLSELVSDDALLDVLLASQDGVYVKDRDGRYLMINSAGAAHLGYEPEQLVGKTDQEIFPGELGERLALSDQEIMAAGETRSLEEPVIVGGKLHGFLTTKAPLRDAAGGVIGLVGASVDVSAFREADEEVRRREAQLAEAQALTNVGSWEWEVASGEQTWSAEAYRILGLNPADPAPTFEGFLDRVHPEDRDRLAEEVAKAIAPGSTGRYALEHRIVRPDGEERLCSCRGRVFFDLDGTPLRMIGAVQDVTEQRAVEAKLAERVVELEVAQELTGLGSWSWDPAADLVTWSPGMYRISGLEPGQFEGTYEAHLERLHPEDRPAWRERAERAMGGGDPGVAEARVVRPDGELRVIRSQMRVLRDDAGRPIRLIGACEDITER